MKQQNLYITQNSPFVQHIAVKDAAGSPINITGFTPTMYISKYFGSETKYNVPVSIYDGVGGIVKVSINSTGTATLPYGTMQYTLYLAAPEADKSVILNAQAIIIPSV